MEKNAPLHPAIYNYNLLKRALDWLKKVFIAWHYDSYSLSLHMQMANRPI